MSQIVVTNGFGRLVLRHEGTKVTASGGKDALVYWRDLQRLGLHGAFGHYFDPNDCFVSDVFAAVLSKYDRKAVDIDVEDLVQVKKELSNYPKGAIP